MAIAWLMISSPNVKCRPRARLRTMLNRDCGAYGPLVRDGLCVPSMGTLQTGFKSPVEIPEHENEETTI